MKRPCTEDEQAILIHSLGHAHGDGWKNVFIDKIEAYVVLDDEYRIVYHVVKTWPYCIPPQFIQESKVPTYQGQNI
jgi:hypothetical protein